MNEVSQLLSFLQKGVMMRSVLSSIDGETEAEPSLSRALTHASQFVRTGQRGVLQGSPTSLSRRAMGLDK